MKITFKVSDNEISDVSYYEYLPSYEEMFSSVDGVSVIIKENWCLLWVDTNIYNGKDTDINRYYSLTTDIMRDNILDKLINE